MASEDKGQELSETPMVGVRLGPLRARVEAACKRGGVDMSEFIRKAIEKELHSHPYEGYLICLQAARSFEKMMEAAHTKGLMDNGSWKQIHESLHNLKFSPNGLADQLERLFQEENPGAVEAEKEYRKKYEDWKRRGRKGPEPLREDSTRDDWWDRILARIDFSDIRRATNLLRELPPPKVGLPISRIKSDSESEIDDADE